MKKKKKNKTNGEPTYYQYKWMKDSEKDMRSVIKLQKYIAQLHMCFISIWFCMNSIFGAANWM